MQSFHAGKMPYEHWESVTDLQTAIATVVDEMLLEDILQSPTYSIMIDESTDISSEKTLIFYVRYLKNGISHTRFLDVLELEGDKCTGENIAKVCFDLLANKNLPLEKLSSIATDGASVMTGCSKGVVAHIKKVIPWMFSIHCIAHRLALASGQAADHKGSYLKKYQAMINAIYKYYHYSPKHQAKLNRVGIVFNKVVHKFKQTFPTRWLSFESAVDAVLENYDALLSCLKEDENDGDPTAHGLLIFVSNFLFLAVSHYMSDTLKILADLSRLFQTKNLEFSSVSCSVSGAIGALQTMQTEPGGNLKKFFELVPYSSVDNFEWGEGNHLISNSKTQQVDFEVVRNNFSNAIVDNLKSRFEDGDIVGNFSILDPKLMPKKISKNFTTYGAKEIDNLEKHFNRESTTIESPFTTSKLRVEWWSFREILSSRFDQCSFLEMSETVLNSESLALQFPSISHLIKVALCLPVTTADCERGFAKYNLIKTELRNRLKPESVAILMKISVDTPTVKDMNNFNFKRAFDIWCATKDRRLGNYK